MLFRCTSKLTRETYSRLKFFTAATNRDFSKISFTLEPSLLNDHNRLRKRLFRTLPLKRFSPQLTCILSYGSSLTKKLVRADVNLDACLYNTTITHILQSFYLGNSTRSVENGCCIYDFLNLSNSHEITLRISIISNTSFYHMLMAEALTGWTPTESTRRRKKPPPPTF